MNHFSLLVKRFKKCLTGGKPRGMIILIHFSKALYRKPPDRWEPDKVVTGLPSARQCEPPKHMRHRHIIHPAKELP